MKLFILVFLIFISCKTEVKKTLPKKKIKNDTVLTESQKISKEFDSINFASKKIFKMKQRQHKVFEVDDYECFWYCQNDEVFLYGTGVLVDRVYVMLRIDDAFGEIEFEDFERKWFEKNLDACFVDVNLDGNKDFVIYSKEKSGNGGRFYDVYLFNAKESVFWYSEHFSGGDLQIDKENNTASMFWKSGVRSNVKKVYHFKNGFIEVFKNKVFRKDSVDYLKSIYERRNETNKLLKRKIDTTVFSGW